MLVRLTHGIVDSTIERPGFSRQMSTLLWRDSVVAVRDPTLYYLQVRGGSRAAFVFPSGTAIEDDIGCFLHGCS